MARAKSKKIGHITIGQYHDFLDTGIIPLDLKRPSRKAKRLLKFLGLAWVVLKLKK